MLCMDPQYGTIHIVASSTWITIPTIGTIQKFLRKVGPQRLCNTACINTSSTSTVISPQSHLKLVSTPKPIHMWILLLVICFYLLVLKSINFVSVGAIHFHLTLIFSSNWEQLARQADATKIMWITNKNTTHRKISYCDVIIYVWSHGGIVRKGLVIHLNVWI